MMWGKWRLCWAIDVIVVAASVEDAVRLSSKLSLRSRGGFGILTIVGAWLAFYQRVDPSFLVVDT